MNILPCGNKAALAEIRASIAVSPSHYHPAVKPNAWAVMRGGVPLVVLNDLEDAVDLAASFRYSADFIDPSDVGPYSVVPTVVKR